MMVRKYTIIQSTTNFNRNIRDSSIFSLTKRYCLFWSRRTLSNNQNIRTTRSRCTSTPSSLSISSFREICHNKGTSIHLSENHSLNHRCFHTCHSRPKFGRLSAHFFHNTKGIVVDSFLLRLFTSKSSIRASIESSSSGIVDSVLSSRQLAALEDHLYQAVSTSVYDPVLKKTLHDLNWLNKRIAVSRRPNPVSSNNNSDGIVCIDLLLKLSSLLHPSLDILKQQIQDAAQHSAQVWFRNHNTTSSIDPNNIIVNVEAITSKPVSFMARLLDDPEELLKSLGPGLSCVSHIIAVYSCKVRF
jgi:hypothetical protein